MAKYLIQEKEYRFQIKDEDGKESHVHEILIDGVFRPAIGISSVVKDITNFGMAAYYGSRRALMELGYDPKDAPQDLKSFKAFAFSSLDMENIKLQKLLKSAYTAHAKYAKKRADKGTDSHEILSVWAKRCMKENNGYFILGETVVEGDKVAAFLRMIIPIVGQNARIIATEKHSWNKDLFLAGIVDLVIEDCNGKLVIVDFKDRPVIYDKDLLQCFGYSLIFPQAIDYIVGVPLEGEKAWEYHDIEKGRRAFLGQLESYKFRNSLLSPYKQ